MASWILVSKYLSNQSLKIDAITITRTFYSLRTVEISLSFYQYKMKVSKLEALDSCLLHSSNVTRSFAALSPLTEKLGQPRIRPTI